MRLQFKFRYVCVLGSKQNLSAHNAPQTKTTECHKKQLFFATSMRSELSSGARTVLSHEISSDRNEANEPIQHCSSFCSKSKASGHAHLAAKNDCTRAYKCLCTGQNETTKASGSSDTVHNGPTWQI